LQNSSALLLTVAVKQLTVAAGPSSPMVFIPVSEARYSNRLSEDIPAGPGDYWTSRYFAGVQLHAVLHLVLYIDYHYLPVNPLPQ